MLLENRSNTTRLF